MKNQGGRRIKEIIYLNTPTVKGINHITLAVTNLERSFNFYRNILGLKPLCRWDNGAYFLVGELWFCLNVDPNHRANPGYTHYAFTVTNKEFIKISEHILDSGSKVFKENTSPGDSLYFLDPDGHKLELHVGNWQTRIESKKKDTGSWKDVEWFI
jgi:catechol 2,3-dioxygenase-like lactoylglutathione lyase family enzyme